MGAKGREWYNGDSEAGHSRVETDSESLSSSATFI